MFGESLILYARVKVCKAPVMCGARQYNAVMGLVKCAKVVRSAKKLDLAAQIAQPPVTMLCDVTAHLCIQYTQK